MTPGWAQQVPWAAASFGEDLGSEPSRRWHPGAKPSSAGED